MRNEKVSEEERKEVPQEKIRKKKQKVEVPRPCQRRKRRMGVS